MSFLTLLISTLIKTQVMRPEKTAVLPRIAMMMMTFSRLLGTALNKVSVRPNYQILLKLIRVYNFVFPLVNTVSDATTGQPEAVNIAKEEEPDEKDLNDNQFILSST